MFALLYTTVQSSSSEDHIQIYVIMFHQMTGACASVNFVNLSANVTKNAGVCKACRGSQVPALSETGLELAKKHGGPALRVSDSCTISSSLQRRMSRSRFVLQGVSALISVITSCSLIPAKQTAKAAQAAIYQGAQPQFRAELEKRYEDGEV